MEKRVKVTIDKEGNYALEALEGFSGTSCVDQTKSIEIAIGGIATEEGKTNSFYDSDGEAPVFIDME